MDLPYLMDTMFDLLNESDNLNVTELKESESAGRFELTTQDGTRVIIQCTILE